VGDGDGKLSVSIKFQIRLSLSLLFESVHFPSDISGGSTQLEGCRFCSNRIQSFRESTFITRWRTLASVVIAARTAAAEITSVRCSGSRCRSWPKVFFWEPSLLPAERPGVRLSKKAWSTFNISMNVRWARLRPLFSLIAPPFGCLRSVTWLFFKLIIFLRWVICATWSLYTRDILSSFEW